MTTFNNIGRRSVATLAIAGMLGGFATGNAFAVDRGVDFNGIVPNGTCTLNATPGTLGVSVDYTRLGSELAAANGAAAGNAGSVEVTTTSEEFEISIDTTNIAWVAPANADATSGASPTLTAKYEYLGATMVGQATDAPSGVTSADVHLLANNNGAAFAPGTYTGTVTVTCEPRGL